MAERILEVDLLRKQFGTFRAVDDISFHVERGQVVGLLGPNGAGKTTTIHMIIGLTRYDGGTVKYFGKDLQTHRGESLQRINFTSSYNTLQGRITVAENLRVFADLYRVTDQRRVINELVDYFEVRDLMDQTFWSLSAGQRTRINLIKSLLNEPELLLMDEPTASLDPDIADKTLSLIEDLREARGLSIVYTSHNMAEVARICDTVVFLDHGKIVASDTPVGLTRRIPTAEVRLIFAEGGRDAIGAWLVANNHDHRFVGDHTVVITTREGAIPQLLFGVSSAGAEITDIEIHKPTLEDVFLQIARA